MISQLVLNVRAETVGGIKYLVAPITLIVPGVLSGSHGPILYSLNELQRSVEDWNNRAITWKHPADAMSAKVSHVWEAQGIGRLENARIVSGRLVADGRFEVERTKRISPETLAALNGHKRIEVSTGLHIDRIDQPGFDALGRAYTGIATNFRPDHLAILGYEAGACSLLDGCGVNNAEVLA